MKRFNLLVVIGFLGLILSGCYSAAVEQLWLKSPGWGRAQLVGNQGVATPAPVAVGSNGHIYLFWVGKEGDGLFLMLRGLDEEGSFLWQERIDLPAGRVDDPELVWVNDRLYLFWLLDKQLYSIVYDGKGNQIVSPKLVSGGVDVMVDTYVVAGYEGEEVAVWFAGNRRKPGVYAVVNDQAQLVDATGVRPDLIFDERGQLHASWMFYPLQRGIGQYFYASYQNGAYDPAVTPSVLYEPRISNSSAIEGPWLGTDNELSYLLWNTTIRTGIDAGRSTTEYLSFPLGNPTGRLLPTSFRIPTASELPYEDVANRPLEAGKRVPFGRVPANSQPGPTQMSLNRMPAGELALATRVENQFELRQTVYQISVAFFQNGQPTATQLLSFTPGSSARPYLISDEQKHLYLTWNEPVASGFDIYFHQYSNQLWKRNGIGLP